MPRQIYPLTAKPVGRDHKKIGICFGNWPITDYFHDQTIFIKDYELYIIGHSLVHRDAFCQFPFRWIYYCHGITGKMHLCAVAKVVCTDDLMWNLKFKS